MAKGKSNTVKPDFIREQDVARYAFRKISALSKPAQRRVMAILSENIGKLPKSSTDAVFTDAAFEQAGEEAEAVLTSELVVEETAAPSEF